MAEQSKQFTVHSCVESVGAGDKRVALITVISAGLNATNTVYYPAEVLKRDIEMFAPGTKMYFNHPTLSERRELPERDVRQWAATISESWYNGDMESVQARVSIEDEWLVDKLRALKKSGNLQAMNVSVNVLAETVLQENVEHVSRIIKVKSVDFVTEGAAGGKVEHYESKDNVSIRGLTVDLLKSERPDLIKEIIEKEQRIMAEDKDLTKRVNELEESLKATKKTAEDRVAELEAQLKAEQEKSQAAIDQRKRIETQESLRKELEKSKLPDVTKARIAEQFKDATSLDKLSEVVAAEKGYVKALTESIGDNSPVKNLGPTGGANESGADAKNAAETARKDLLESYVAEYVQKGMTLEDAKEKAALVVRQLKS